jgi:hypothetical protein
MTLNKLIRAVGRARALISRLSHPGAFPNADARGREWEQLLQDLSPDGRIVWAREFPRELGHECAKLREVIDSCGPGDGMPAKQLSAMTHCYWCGVPLPGRVQADTGTEGDR